MEEGEGVFVYSQQVGSREWGRRERARTDDEAYTYTNNKEATTVCLNCAQLINVNYMQTIPYRKGTPIDCGDVWLCIATHCRSESLGGGTHGATLEGFGDGSTGNLDCEPRVWEG